MSRELLPIGSVVKIKDTEKAMMICGFCPSSPARPGYVYDYSGFPYPEGYVDTMKIYEFDNEQIDKILAIGYQDRETFLYMNALQDKIEEIKEKIAQKAARAAAELEEEEAQQQEDAQN